MKLKLILKGPERLMGAQIEKTLENGSLVVGRSPAADWVLPDPERIVSKAHCRIDTDFSGFVLTDTSTNGVFINDDPVGFGLPRLLGDSDVLRLGDAVILVRIEAGQSRPAGAALPAQPPPAPVAAGPADGPFGGEAPAPSAPQPNRSPVEPSANAPSEKILDDWWAPEEPIDAPAAPIPVDISPSAPQGEIPNTITAQDPLPSQGGDVAKLVSSLAGIDLLALARAVDAAGAALPQPERQNFHERLRELLVGSESPGK